MNQLDLENELLLRDYRNKIENKVYVNNIQNNVLHHWFICYIWDQKSCTYLKYVHPESLSIYTLQVFGCFQCVICNPSIIYYLIISAQKAMISHQKHECEVRAKFNIMIYAFVVQVLLSFKI